MMKHLVRDLFLGKRNQWSWRGKPAHRRGAALGKLAPLGSEQLEQRIAMTVSVGGYPNTSTGYPLLPGAAFELLPGPVIIASSAGDDVFVKQVASVTQALLVSDNSSFLGANVVDNVGGYSQIYVTNGVAREDAFLLPTMSAEALTQTRLMLADEEVFWFGGGGFPSTTSHAQIPGPTGLVHARLDYVQADGTVSQWFITMAGGYGGGTIANIEGPGFGGVAVPLGHIFPTRITYLEASDTSNDIGEAAGDYNQGWFDVDWSGPTNPSRLPALLVGYYSADSLVEGRRSPYTVRANVPGSNSDTAAASINFILRDAKSEADETRSLGVIPGTVSGSISAGWTSSSRGVTSSFTVDSAGGVVFGNGSRVLFVSGNALVTQGLVVVTGNLVTDRLVFTYRKFEDWQTQNGFVTQIEAINPLRGDIFIGGVVSPVSLSNVSYLTYSQSDEPNTASFVEGQTISRDVIVDLLTPGSTLAIDNPIQITPGGTPDDPSTEGVNGAVAGPAGILDFKATNIEVAAESSASPAGRVFVGHTQSLEGERLTAGLGNPFLFASPSVNGSVSGAGSQAVAIAEINPAGEVVAITLLPGFEGARYKPELPPVVTVSGLVAAANPGDPPTPVAFQGVGVVADGGWLVGFDFGLGLNNYGPLTGFVAIPQVTIQGPLLFAAATARVAQIDAASGGITGVAVLDPGGQYQSPPRVVVEPPSPGDDHRAATVRAILGLAGEVVAIEVIDPGKGYVTRPQVTIAAPVPIPYTESLEVRSRLDAGIFELYVGDDFGTDTPRGTLYIFPGAAVAAPAPQLLAPTITLTPGQPVQVVIDPTSIPGYDPLAPVTSIQGFNPTGSSVENTPGVADGTVVSGWNATALTLALPEGSVAEGTIGPILLRLGGQATDVFVEAHAADIRYEGTVSATRQSYLMNSPVGNENLAPFVFTTTAAVTDTPSGIIRGGVVDITLGNDMPTPLTGAAITSVVDLQTTISSLRVSAAESRENPQGAFPYDLRIANSSGTLSVDAVPATSGTLEFITSGNIAFTSEVRTDGDFRVDAQENFTVSAPVSTSRGQVGITASSIDVGNSLSVTAAAVAAGRPDIALTAKSGTLNLNSGISAVNDVTLVQAGPADQGINGASSRVRAESLSVTSTGSVDLRTDVTTLSGVARSGFKVSEVDDIFITSLTSGGLVSLEAEGVDAGLRSPNSVALVANLVDVDNLWVNTPRGSARIDINGRAPLVLGDVNDLAQEGPRAQGMTAAGDVTIRAEVSDIRALDLPLAGSGAIEARVATPEALPAATVYIQGLPGVRPSGLSGVGDINKLTTEAGEPYWGLDTQGKPIVLSVGDKVLVKDQADLETTPGDERRANGIYRVARLGGGAYGSTKWELVRASEADAVDDLPSGSLVRVLEGEFANVVYALDYASVPRTLVERVSTNLIQLPPSFGDFDRLEIGQLVTGTGIAPNSFISAIDRVARTVSLDVFDAGTAYTLPPVTVALDPGNADKLILDPGFTGLSELRVGQLITGEGIAAGAVIEAIDVAARSIEVSQGVLPSSVFQIPIESSKPFAVVLPAEFTVPGNSSIKSVADVRIGQRMVLADATFTQFALANVSGVNIQTNSVGFTNLRSAGDGSPLAGGIPGLPFVPATASFVGIGFALKSTVEFGVGDPGAVAVEWNQWNASGSALSPVVVLPTFVDFADLTIGQEVSGPNIPAGTTLVGFNAAIRTITLSALPIGLVTQVTFGVGATALYPGVDVLELPASFTNYDRLFPGQPIYGDGISAGAVITEIDPVRRTIRVTPGALPPLTENVGVTLASDRPSRFYPADFDNWVELDYGFNDYFDIRVGQIAEFRDASGTVIGIGPVTGVDGTFRTVGFADGTIANLVGGAGAVETVTFRPISWVRFGVIEGVGASFVDFATRPIGRMPIDVTKRPVTLNVGSDVPSDSVEFVVSTGGGSIDAPGSLNKMLLAQQVLDTTRTVVDVSVFGVEQRADGTWKVSLDPLFTEYDRLANLLEQGGPAPVSGTPRMFTSAATLVDVESRDRAVILSPESFSDVSLDPSGNVIESLITFVRLPIETLNPSQQSELRFWSYAPQQIQLTQELPLIERAVRIDGSLVQTQPVAGNGLQPTAGPFVVDGSTITVNRAGSPLKLGDTVNGFEFFGAGATGSSIAGLRVGGFSRGAAIAIDRASDVLVSGMRLGTNAANERNPNQFGVRVAGSTATNNTVLGSEIVGSTAAGVAFDEGAFGNYIVGTTVGTLAIDNTRGVFVGSDSNNNVIGVDPITPGSTLVMTSGLTAGSIEIPVSPVVFTGTLIGLDVVGTGIQAGTRIVGFDSSRQVAYLSKPATVSQNSSISIGYYAGKELESRGANGQFRFFLKPGDNLPLDEVYVGQSISGDGIIPGTTIVGIDRESRRIEVSQRFANSRSGFVSFAAPGRNAFAYNRRGIVLGGSGNRVTNSDIVGNTIDGIRLQAGADAVIGTQVAEGSVGGGSGPYLASYPVTARTTDGSTSLALPASFSGLTAGGTVTVGDRVFGDGIAPDTTIAAISPAAAGGWSVQLSKPMTETRTTSAIAFGINGGTRWTPKTAADLGRLTVGQTVSGVGVPEYSQIVALSIRGDGTGVITISAPQAALADPNFTTMAGPVSFSKTSSSSNAIYGNEQFGIRVDDPVLNSKSRIARNVFARIASGTASEENYFGPVNFAGVVGAIGTDFEPGEFSQVDRFGNVHGIGEVGGGGSPTNPLDPSRPRV